MDNNSRKIIFTVTNDLTYDQRMHRICSTLAEAGNEVLLVGRKMSHSKALESKKFQQKRLKCFFNKGKIFYLEYNIRLFFFLLFSSFEMVCSIDLDTILAGLFVSRIRKKKVVYDAHEYFTEVPELVDRPKTKAIWERIANYAIPKVNACYTVGPCLAKIFKEKYKKEFEVIRNVPFPSRDQRIPKTLSRPAIVIYQGALNKGRGIEATLDAFSLLDKSEAVLWIVGEGDLSSTLRLQAARLKLGEQVKFWGYQKPSDLKELTHQADIGLNLLENQGLNYYYSLANKFFDYIMAGVPSINMDFPEYKAIFQSYNVGILMESTDSELLAKEIKSLVNSGKTYAELVKNCEKAALEYNWEKEKIKLLNFYKTLG